MQDQGRRIYLFSWVENAETYGNIGQDECKFWQGIDHWYGSQPLVKLLWSVHFDLSFEQHINDISGTPQLVANN